MDVTQTITLPKLPRCSSIMKLLVLLMLLSFTAIALSAQDGGPQPYCPSGSQCCAGPIGSITPLTDGPSNKPCCYFCERGQKTFGEVNKDKEIAAALTLIHVHTLPNKRSLNESH